MASKSCMPLVIILLFSFVFATPSVAAEELPDRIINDIRKYGTFSGNGHRIVRASTPMFPRLYNEHGCVELGKSTGNSDNRVRIPDLVITKVIRYTFLEKYYSDPFNYEEMNKVGRRKVLPNIKCGEPNDTWTYPMTFYIFSDEKMYLNSSRQKLRQKNWFHFRGERYGKGICSISLNIVKNEIKESRVYIKSIRNGIPSSDEKPQLACMIKGVWASLGMLKALDIPDEDVLSHDYKDIMDSFPETKYFNFGGIARSPDYVRFFFRDYFKPGDKLP